MQELKDHFLDSSAISCSMVLNPNISISSLLGVPKLLLVKILAALCRNFFNWLISAEPAHPQTEQQYRKCEKSQPRLNPVRPQHKFYFCHVNRLNLVSPQFS